MSWFLTTRVGRWISMIAAFAALLVGAVFFGWSKRGQHEATKALKGYKETRERMDDAEDLGDDPHAADRWLHERLGKRDL